MKEVPSVFDVTKIRWCLLFINPKSTRSSMAKKYLKELQKNLPDCEIEEVETSPKGVAGNRRLLEARAEKLGTECLICIAAGDGTVNQIIEAMLLSHKLTPAQKTSYVLPLGGGNANDLANMLNGAPAIDQLGKIIRRGKVVSIRPLRCTMEHPDRKMPKRRLAVCYAGFGATAFAAMSLNKPAHRKSKLHARPGGHMAQNILTVAGALVGAPQFAVEETDKTKTVYEQLFSNGPRVATFEYLPVKLTDRQFYANTLHTRWPTSAIPKLVDSTRKSAADKFLRKQASFTTKEKVWGQFDGEPLEIPAHTKVQIDISPRAFYALSTKLNK